MATSRKPHKDLRTPTGPPDAYVQLSFHLPKFYLRVLDGEAAFLRIRRAQVLEQLVSRKMGRVRLERSPSAPKYKVQPNELRDVARYLWHCRKDVKAELDQLREKLGNIPARDWVILALNEWIGFPGGTIERE